MSVRNFKDERGTKDVGRVVGVVGEQRPALDWKEIERIQRGFTIATINSAERQDGSKIYSWCIGKEGRRDDKVMKFLDPRDIEDAHDVIDDVKDFIAEERAAERRQ